MRWLKTLLFGRAGTVSFCDGCGQVCDGACRADRLRDQALLRAASSGAGGLR